MKINKKVKYTFISSLTLVAFVVSVVACGSKTKKEDGPNYKLFTTSISSYFSNDENKKKFAENDSSLKLLKSNDINLKVDVDTINFDKVMLFDPAESKDYKFLKLSDFNYKGGITYDTDEAIFNIKNSSEKFYLKNIIFAANFNVNFTIQKSAFGPDGNKSVTLDGLTAFFTLNYKNQNICFNEFDRYTTNINYDKSLFNKDKFNLDDKSKEGFDTTKYQFGIPKSINNIAGGNFIENPNDFVGPWKHIGTFLGLVNSTNFEKPFEFDSSSGEITVQPDKFFVSNNYWSYIKDKKNEYSVFVVGIFDATNPKLFKTNDKFVSNFIPPVN